MSLTVLNGRIKFDGQCDETRKFCGSVCCRNTVVYLTQEESESNTYDMVGPSTNCNCANCQTMRAKNTKMLRRTDNGCVYLDGEGKCSIYDRRPKVCSSYVCEDVWWNLHLPQTRHIGVRSENESKVVLS